MRAILKKPIVWNVISVLVVAAIAIRVAMVLGTVMWLVAAFREPKTYLYPFLVPVGIGVFYASKTGALVVGGTFAVFAIYNLWTHRDLRGKAAPPALPDHSHEQEPKPQ